MCAGASLHANQTRRQIPKECRYLGSPQLLAQHRLTPFINPMHLKQILRQINPDGCNLIVDAPIRLSGCSTHPLWHIDAD
jgi:hypothetical protein